MANRYVDLSATNNGDGTAANQAASGGATGAWNSLATMLAAVSSGDVVYIRRVTATSTLSSSSTLVGGVTYAGWPKSGDALYSGRPASGTSNGWDSDGADYPDWTYTVASAALTVAGGTNITLSRVKVKNSAAGSAVCFTHTSGTGLSVTGCYFQTTNASATPNCVKLNAGAGVSLTFNNNTIDLAATGDTLGSVLQVGSAANLYNTTILVTTHNSSGANHPVYIMTNGSGGSMINTTFTVTTVSGTAEPVLYMVPTTGFLVKNFAASHTNRTASGTGAAWLHISSSIGNILQNVSCTFGTHVSIAGAGNEVEIMNWTQRQAVTGGGIQITAAGNVVTVGATSFVSGNTSGDIAFLSGSNGSVCIARGTSFVTGPVWNSNNGCRMYSFDHNQVSNNLKMQYFNGNIVASTVYRSSGEAFSLQATPTDSATGKHPMMVVAPRGRESIWLSLSSGARTVTLYFACKNLSPDAGDIWAEAEYADGNQKPVIVSSHSPGTALTSDSSTWNGDSGLTIFKIVLSFTLPSAQAVPIRVFFGKYVSGGYCYLDPKPEST